jgi:hypothetical protein
VKSRYWFTLIIGIMMVSILSSRPVKEGSSKDLDQWIADADIPLDPNNPGHYVEWYVKLVSNVYHSANYSLELSIDGSQDDGTVWITRKISVKDNTEVKVRLSFYLYSETKSANLIAEVIAYAGSRKPEKEDDFIKGQLGPANQISGWKRYEYIDTVNIGREDQIWVAIGISVLWETSMTYNIDDITIEIL